MNDAPDAEAGGKASRPAEMDVPDDANDDEFTGDELTEATPPNTDEAEETPEAGPSR